MKTYLRSLFWLLPMGLGALFVITQKANDGVVEAEGPVVTVVGTLLILSSI